MIFAHSGDLGDVVMQLPAVRGLGGGKVVLYPAACTNHRMTPERAAVLIPLLLAQPYVTEAVWAVEPEGLNLDAWRAAYDRRRNLTDTACRCFGVPYPPRTEPWLSAEPERVARVVFARGPRYQNRQFPWRKVWERYHRDAVFVGLPDEHAAFERVVGKVAYRPTPTLLDVARVIAGAELFAGSQSAPLAIAEGLKKRMIVEVYPQLDNCRFARPGVTYVRGAAIRHLPKLP